MKVQIYVRLDECDLNGKVIRKGRYKKANSLVQAFMAYLAASHITGSVTNVPDTSNTNRTLNFAVNPLSWWGGTGGKAVGGITAYGIVAGIGTNAVAITNYSLQTLIAHGTGAGQLTYGAMVETSSWTVSGSASFFEATRTLINNSAGNITIEEIGFIVNLSSTTHRFLWDRTLTGGYTVNVGAGVIINYKWQISV